MEAEKLVFYHSRHGEVVENIAKILSNVRVSIFANALIVEAISLGNNLSFVITAEDADPISETYLEGKKQRHDFDALVAPVHVVAHEAVVCPRQFSADLKDLHQVVELPVNIPAYRHRRPHGRHILLVLENLLGLGT
jgi:hypothetical protein